MRRIVSYGVSGIRWKIIIIFDDLDFDDDEVLYFDF